jgi:hypothetical protein
MNPDILLGLTLAGTRTAATAAHESAARDVELRLPER